jgi:hypothetical protein
MSATVIGFYDWVVRREQVVLGCLVTLILAALYDLLKLGSVFGIRRLGNKFSEYSVARLQKRIDQLQQYRDVVNSYLSSDRALYLATMQLLLAISVLACIGAVSVSLHFLFPSQGSPMYIVAGIFVFLIVIVLGVHGAQLAGLNARSKIAAILARYDADIYDLKTKLEARLHKITQAK